MPLDQSKMIDAAMRLRSMDPVGWEDFLRAMQTYQAQQLAEMLRSDPALLMRAQGMALALNELFQTLRDAPQTKEKQLAKRLEKQHV